MVVIAGNMVGKVSLEVDIIDIKEFEREIKRIDNLLDLAKKDVCNAPKGRLRIAHNHGTEQYYHVSVDSDMSGKYISKKNSDFVHLLAQKDYASRFIKYLEQKKKYLENIRDRIKSYDDNKIYEDLNDSRKRLISPYYITDMEYIANWIAEPYEAKKVQEEQPEIITERGERVRSKSEKMIADKLLMLGIPYKYEHPIYLADVGVVYPDFTLLDIKNREDVLLEHFGMMDNSTYCENVIKKINAYQNNGYFMGKNILYTFETYKNPSNMKNIEIMIRRKFGV